MAFKATPGEQVTVSAPGQASIDYRELAREIAAEIRRAMDDVALSVSVEDIHGGLLRKKKRNGVLGLA